MKLSKKDNEMIDKASDIVDIYQQIKGVSQTQSDLISKKEMIKNNHELKDLEYSIFEEEYLFNLLGCSNIGLSH